MTAVLPHYKMGPANLQAATLIFGGQFVMPNTQGYASTDYTVKLATNGGSPAGTIYTLGVAGNDAAPITTQTGAANTYGEPQIDISVLTDYVSVWYGGVDIFAWYSNCNAYCGQLLTINSIYGTVGPWTEQGASYAQAAGDPGLIVGRCMVNGGVSTAMCTQQIGGGAGGGGASSYYLGRVRVLV
jgi:hypothetical protein